MARRGRSRSDEPGAFDPNFGVLNSGLFGRENGRLPIRETSLRRRKLASLTNDFSDVQFVAVGGISAKFRSIYLSMAGGFCYIVV